MDIEKNSYSIEIPYPHGFPHLRRIGLGDMAKNIIITLNSFGRAAANILNLVERHNQYIKCK